MRRISAALALLAVAGCGLRLSSGRSGSPRPDARLCDAATDCPKPAEPCLIAACVDGACSEQVAPAGAVPEAQAAGDCKELVCDGRGQAITREDRGDTPVDDHNDCTEERCAGDSPERAPLAAGAACGEGGVCNGAGVCGVCVPGKRRCEAKAPEACDASGQWIRGAACAGSTPVCSRGGCNAIVDLALGEGESCFLLSDGSARCWGSGLSGSLGAVRDHSRIPISGATDLVVGARHACAIAGGAVTCWGDGDKGQLSGHPSVSGAVQLAAGDDHTCARLGDGSVVCWGKNDKHQLGGGATSAKDKHGAPPSPGPRAAPVDLEGPFAQLAVGFDRACARDRGGSVICWGAGTSRSAAPAAPHVERAAPSSKPLPHTKPGHAPPPKPAPAAPKLAAVRGIKGAQQVAAGGDQTCARLADGSISCWGAAGKGSGSGPAPVAGLKGALAIAVGRAHACALTRDGEVACWGENDKGQLGEGGAKARRAPGKVAGIAGATAIAARGDHTCARLGDGSVRCWGSNAAGELGSGSAEATGGPGEVRW